MEISTLLTTAPTSVRASHKGLPVSRVMSSANSASFLRTTLAKRRSASIRNACDWAAHAGQAARAAATSTAASPISPDQTFLPVAGSEETNFVLTGFPSTTSDNFSTCRCILLHPLPHSADRCNLVRERLPVVAYVNRRPDRLDLVDVHRAGSIVRPICVRLGAFAAFEKLCKLAEFAGGVKLHAPVAAPAPADENA